MFSGKHMEWWQMYFLVKPEYRDRVRFQILRKTM